MKKFSLKRGAAAVLAAAALALPLSLAGVAPAAAAGKAAPLVTPEEGWPFEGVLGRYDDASLQRGLKVYKEICSACHGLKYLSYRNLGEAGGPGFTEAEVKAFAAQFQVPAGPDEFGNVMDENGLPRTRPALPSDNFVYPFPNEQAARAANGGAYPPDLSLMAKARYNGADYIYSLLQGYVEPPEGLNVPPGQYYNKYFPGDTKPFWEGEGPPPPGGFIAMAQPLYEEMVVFDDGTEASLEQMSYDLGQFLMWAAEPKLEQRKELGLRVMLFLALLTVLLYLTYRRVWRNVEH